MSAQQQMLVSADPAATQQDGDRSISGATPLAPIGRSPVSTARAELLALGVHPLIATALIAEFTAGVGHYAALFALIDRAKLPIKEALAYGRRWRVFPMPGGLPAFDAVHVLGEPRRQS